MKKNNKKIRKCKICNTYFTPHHKRMFLCSIPCRSKWISGENHYGWKGKIKRVCKICNSVFEIYPSELKKIHHGKVGSFCSKQCYGIWLRTNKIGENNNFWKGGISSLYERLKSLEENHVWRYRIFCRDKFTCQICNKKSDGDLNAHHVKPYKDILRDFLQEYSQFSLFDDKETLVRLATTYKPFWDVNNGITLCEYCHKKEHNNFVHKAANAVKNGTETNGGTK